MPNVREIRSTGFLWLEITPKCNLSCVHCYADSGPDEPLTQNMAPRDWIRVLDEAAQLSCRAVQFIGGEPTLHPDLPQLIGHARTLGFKVIEVYTNGTRLTESLKKTFVHNH